ncbi:hypothetical protein GJAV_G00224590 [Gymnothorax javanicus]|nr:hypothetical protein GJAV_G00224590 [Gymnothorax javanicus]
MSLHNFGLEPLSCHAWNKDKSQIAISPNNNEVHIYQKSGKGWNKIHELTEHSGRITGIDWAPESNRIVTCARTGMPTGARLISVCYFEQENDWWLSKHIKKAIRSTVLSLDWHPNNILLAAGSADLHCRVFSAYIKDIEDKPGPTAWGVKMPFGEVLLEHKDCGGWVHGVSFSPSGDSLAWVSHNSSISVADAAQGKEVTRLTTQYLPLMSVLHINETDIVAAGHDCCPYQFSYKGPGKLKFEKKLDIPKDTSKGEITAMQRFRNLDMMNKAEEENRELDTLHQNSIMQLRPVEGDRASVEKFSTVGLDGAMGLWDIKP